MSGCCNDNCSLNALREKQRGTLQIVLGINAVMFLVIAAAALYGNTTALLADSLDNLGDALTYGLSLYAVSRSAAVKARVALFKGGLIFLAAFGCLFQASPSSRSWARSALSVSPPTQFVSFCSGGIVTKM